MYPACRGLSCACLFLPLVAGFAAAGATAGAGGAADGRLYERRSASPVTHDRKRFSKASGTERSSGQVKGGIMVCSNCGSEVAAGSPTCARCGAPQPAGVAPGAQAHGYQQQQQNPAPGGGWGPAPTYGGGQAPQASGFNFDITRWQRAEQITGGAKLHTIITHFLTSFTATPSRPI